MALKLTLGCGQNDRTIPLQDGTVRPEGIDLQFIHRTSGDLFRRTARHAEFDVSEFSLSTHTLLHARGDRRFVGIPVFPSRKFRHADIYINADAGVQQPGDLVGKRVGVTEFQQSAGVWVRSMLQHDYGVRSDQVEWYFGGVNEPEHFEERVAIQMPPHLRTVTIPPDRCLNEMLERGEIDAFLGSSTPNCFKVGSPHVRRLFPNFWEVELDYYRRTRMFPIMHTVVLKRAIYEEHPWVAASLFQAFARAKAVGWRRLTGSGPLYASLPWLRRHVAETKAVFGPDPFVYGLELNRHVLEAFVQFSHEQGFIQRPVPVADLFAAETHHLAAES